MQGRPVERPRETHVTAVPDVRIEAVDFDAPPSWTEPYRPANLGRAHTYHEMHLPEAPNELRRLIETVVRLEGPVHEERVLQAVRKAWGSGRAGSRIRDAFDRAVQGLTRSGLERDGRGFLKTRFAGVNVVRVPTGDAETRREIRHLPPEELRLAIERLVADAHAIAHEDLSLRVARLFGWQRRGPDIQAALEDAVEALLRAGKLRLAGDLLVVAS